MRRPSENVPVRTNSPRDGDPQELGELWGPEQDGGVSQTKWSHLWSNSLGRTGEGIRERSRDSCTECGDVKRGRRRRGDTFVARGAEASKRPCWWLLGEEGNSARWLEDGGRRRGWDEAAKHSRSNDHKKTPTPLQ